MLIEPLRHSRRVCGGVLSDLKNLASRYPSDFKDALNLQVFLSIIFLYISFLAPAIAFGGLIEEFTDDRIGETETLFATGLCGILFAIFAVQPLTVLAFTGPVIVFEKFVFEVRAFGYSNCPEGVALIGKAFARLDLRATCLQYICIYHTCIEL